VRRRGDDAMPVEEFFARFDEMKRGSVDSLIEI
jgi:hypothetical protein